MNNEIRFHEMSYAEIGHMFAELQASRDRWKALGQHICEFHYNLIPDYIHQLFNDHNKAVRGD